MSTETSASQPTKTKALLNNAVNNTSIFSRKGFLDRLFTKWFDRLVYPQIWEDPEVDIQALNLSSDSNIFTISSGGCNVLNYLSEQPQSITVVDLNEAHIALLNLKLAALNHLPDYEAFFDLFGRADKGKNLDRYYADIEPHLDPKTRAYWAGKEGWFGKKRITYFTDGFYRHGLLGNFIGFIHWISRRLGYDISKVMQARNLEQQKALFDEHVAPVFDTRLVKFLSNRAIVLYSLGIPPSQFDEMNQESRANEMGMHHLLKERARHLACDFPLKDNYFAWQAFNREYDVKDKVAVPRYLKIQYFEAVRQSTKNVTVSHTSMTEKLKSMPDNSLDAYLFLDAQDWMNEEQLTELWQEVNRTSMDNARVVFRTAGTLSPLENKLPGHLLYNWSTDPFQNAKWTKMDRSAIYGAVFMYQKQTSQ